MLRPIEVQAAQGKSSALACHEAETSEQRQGCLRKGYGGLKIDPARTMKDLERENARLRRLAADLSLAGQVLADVAFGNAFRLSGSGLPATHRRYHAVYTSQVNPIAFEEPCVERHLVVALRRIDGDDVNVVETQPRRVGQWRTDRCDHLIVLENQLDHPR